MSSAKAKTAPSRVSLNKEEKKEITDFMRSNPEESLMTVARIFSAKFR